MSPIAFATKTLIGLACTALLATPALANGHRDGHRGHNSGYVSQNHSGYSGRHYNNRQHQGSSHNRSHHGYNDNHRSNNQYRGHDRPSDYYHRGNDRRTYGNNHYRDQRPSHHSRYRNDYRPRYQFNPQRPVLYAPRYANYRNYAPHYNIGYRLKPHRHVRLNDYHRWGLYHPPRGHYWVRHNNDAYLAAAGTGLVAGIIIGALASH